MRLTTDHRTTHISQSAFDNLGACRYSSAPAKIHFTALRLARSLPRETCPECFDYRCVARVREVLRLLLERRGARTIEAERVEEAVGLANRCHPDLIVFDAECDRSTGGDATSNLREVADRNDCPIVILGKVHELLGDWAADQIVAKPYHYEPLIRKINSLLAAA